MAVRERSAGGVVFFPLTKEFLILHFKFKTHYWDFPKGKIEQGETPEQTARREIKEETGLDVGILPGFRETIHYVFRQEKMLISKDVIYFIGKAFSKDAKVSKENLEFKWLPFEAAMKQMTFKNSRNILEKANAFLNKHHSLERFL